jgi:serine/threonine protein kinase
VVWRATDRLLDREVAVKEITYPVHLTESERGVLRERTFREARAAARLASPRVTAVYDVVEEDGRPWLVMEHVPSRSLARVLREDGPLPPVAVARIGLDLLEALEAAHRAGIVHRDVKPANVLVDRDGRAHLTDFGIATTTGDSALTTSGAILGSPAYMAPERANGEEPRPPADLWSLGATLWAAVEGTPPFDRGDPMATLFAAVTVEPAPAQRAGPLEPVLRGLLTKDPARRSTVEQVREQLAAVAAGGGAAWPSPLPSPAPPAAPAPQQPPARARTARRDDDVVRLDLGELRTMLSASRAAVGTVARETRQRVRTAADRHLPAPPPRPPGRRFRFKRRWVVVPVVVLLLLVAAVVAGVVWLAMQLPGLSG